MKVKKSLLVVVVVLAQWVSAMDTDSLQVELSKVDESEKLEILLQLSKAYWTIAPGKGLFHANEAIRLAEHYDNKQLKAKALLYGGVNSYFIGVYDEAISWFQQSLTIARELKDSNLCAFNLNNLGMIHTKLKNYTTAIGFYTQSLQIMKNQNNAIELAKIQNNIAELKMLTGDLDGALNLHLSVLKSVEHSNEPVFLIWLYNDIGSVYQQQSKTDLALEFYERALKVSTKIDDILGKAQTLNHIGIIYLLKKDFSNAQRTLYEALRLSEKARSMSTINDSYKNIADLYAWAGDYKQSLGYYKLHKQLSDSILNNEKMQSIVEMQARYDLESALTENNLLQKNIEINELTIKKKVTQLTLLVLLTGVFAFSILLIYSRLKMKNRINEQLKLTNATKDKFFSIIAHDLKGPVGNIHALSELIHSNLQAYSTEELLSMTKLMKNAAQSTYSLLENLLTWARAQKGEIAFSPELSDITQSIDTAISIVMLKATHKGINLTTNCRDPLPCNYDRHMIETVLVNLLNNATKYTHRSGQISVYAEKTDQWILVSVSDTGVGIKPELIGNLFRIDTKHFSENGTEGEKGTGLGLILCKEFINQHGGQIWVESTPEAGTTFHFTIPCN